jgi:heme A synthase
MERLRRMAVISVGRASAFAALGIFCVMIGLSFDPVLMTRAGGMLSLALTLILILKAELARRQDYRRTEMWLLLRHEERPPKEVAQRLSGTVLRETYLRFAKFAAAACAGLWLAAVTLPMIG